MVLGSPTRNKASNHKVHKMPARLIRELRGHPTPGDRGPGDRTSEESHAGKICHYFSSSQVTKLRERARDLPKSAQQL